MEKETLEVNKKEIQNLGLKSIKSYFLVDPSEITDAKVLQHLLSKAKLGMQFEREMNLSTRASEMNQIRIFKLTTNDKAQLREAIKASMPKYTIS